MTPEEPTMRATVVVASEDVSTRIRIARLIAEEPTLALLATLAAAELPAHISRPDLLILHCDVIQRAEAALLGELRETYPDLRIIAVCASATGRSTRRAADGAVDGLVLADNMFLALVPTVAAVLAGQTAFPRELRDALRKVALSHREKQVLALVARGCTNSEIGTRLFLAESTIKSHLSSAFSKLGVKSRSEAAALILDPHGSLGAGIMASLADSHDASLERV